jgi:hypothetical protein
MRAGDYHRRMRLRSLIAILLLAACAKKDPVVQTLDRIVAAAEDRDAGAITRHLASSYPERAEAERELRRYLFGYKSIDVTIRDLQSRSAPNGGWATFRIDFIGVPKEAGGLDQFLPRSASYRFALDFVAESGTFKISRAEWERER